MEEIPKLDSPSCSNAGCGAALETEEHKSMDTFQCTTDKADDNSFVIDMDSFSSGLNKDNTTNANSRFTRSLSRKGSQRGGDRKINGNATLHDKDVIPPAAALCSPKGSCMPEMAVGSTDHSISPHVHHQIAITANSTTNTSENKVIARRNSFRRSSSWTLDPKRVLLFFATLSSMGTMVLIYFTFIINKQNADHEYGG